MPSRQEHSDPNQDSLHVDTYLIITSIRIKPVPASSGSRALPITVIGAGASDRMACPGVWELTRASPGRTAP